MCLPKEKLARLAQAIQEQLGLLKINYYSQLRNHMSILLEKLDQYQAIQRKLGICTSRNWLAGANTLTKNLVEFLRDIPSLASTVEWSIGPCQKQIPSLGEILAELEQAQQEFPTLAYHAEDQILGVTTEPIELEGVYLGEFEVQLQIPNLALLADRPGYWIKALDPHPAASNGSVTHPHVSDERLCAGDGHSAIKEALASGRICDFFQLANAVLTTYSPDSPFVRLDEWDGRPCYDCGYAMDEDNCYFCASCEHDICEECSACCQACDSIFCRGCLTGCSCCDELYCHPCLNACRECGEFCCPSCLEGELCVTCRENQDMEEPDHEPEEQIKQDQQVA